MLLLTPSNTSISTFGNEGLELEFLTQLALTLPPASCNTSLGNYPFFEEGAGDGNVPGRLTGIIMHHLHNLIKLSTSLLLWFIYFRYELLQLLIKLFDEYIMLLNPLLLGNHWLFLGSHYQDLGCSHFLRI